VSNESPAGGLEQIAHAKSCPQGNYGAVTEFVRTPCCTCWRDRETTLTVTIEALRMALREIGNLLGPAANLSIALAEALHQARTNPGGFPLRQAIEGAFDEVTDLRRRAAAVLGAPERDI